jgi:hypothetical protein
LRYKQGKNLNYEGDRVMEGLKPEKLFLPKANMSTTYVFAIEDQFFAYPNNYNYYVTNSRIMAMSVRACDSMSTKL